MKLAPNWKKIARYSQSFWINVIASVLGSIAVGFQYLFGVLPVSPYSFVAILTALNLAAAIFRLIFQKQLST
jgi:hypothetical protein